MIMIFSHAPLTFYVFSFLNDKVMRTYGRTYAIKHMSKSISQNLIFRGEKY